MKQLKIGLFGFGVVGQGYVEVISKTKAIEAVIKRICIKNPEIKRSFPIDSQVTTNPNEILQDGEINLIVEAISDADAAFNIVRQALILGIPVISANKKMIALNLPELIRLQQETGTPLLYEAAVAASIPIIQALENHYQLDALRSIRAIVNGTTNYILTEMSKGGSYNLALAKAQKAGFAEVDPSNDVEGWDATYKLTILSTHAIGAYIHPQQIDREGIVGIKKYIIDDEPSHVLKLVASLQLDSSLKWKAQVKPVWETIKSELAHIDAEYNGILIETEYNGKHFYKGKGAGSIPTAAALLADTFAIIQKRKYCYNKFLYAEKMQTVNN